MSDIFHFILPAISFGLVAGLKPGPLGVFVIQQTLSGGFGAGMRASLAPFVTDVPIIAAAFLLLSYFQQATSVIAGISLCGGLYALYLGYRILTSSKNGFTDLETSGDFWAAVRLNFLNPGPYLFWFSVGGAYLLAGTFLQSAAFVTFSVGFLVLSKMFVALLSLHFRSYLSSNGYRYTMYVLAIIMCAFGIQLIFRAAMLSELGSMQDTNALWFLTRTTSGQ